MSDKEMWLIVRRALLMIVKAIEKKYPGKAEPLEPAPDVSISLVVDE